MLIKVCLRTHVQEGGPVEIHAMEIVVVTSVCKHHVAAHVLSCCALGHLTCAVVEHLEERGFLTWGRTERISVTLSIIASARFFPPFTFCELVN